MRLKNCEEGIGDREERSVLKRFKIIFNHHQFTYSHDKTRIVEAYVIMPRWLRSITRGNHGNDVIYPVLGEGGIAFRLLLLSSLRASLLPQMLEFPSTTSSLNKPCFRNSTRNRRQETISKLIDFS